MTSALLSPHRPPDDPVAPPSRGEALADDVLRNAANIADHEVRIGVLERSRPGRGVERWLLLAILVALGGVGVELWRLVDAVNLLAMHR